MQSQPLISIDHLPSLVLPMAHLSNFISFLLFATLLLALQISARDSEFFSKVSHFDNNNVKETEVPSKEAPEVNKVDQQPPFVPETENSYGLYGHDESNEVPSTTTTKKVASYTTPTSYHPYKTEFENTRYYNNDAYNNRFAETGYNNQEELSDTKYTEEGYNNNYNNYQNNNNNQKYYQRCCQLQIQQQPEVLQQRCCHSQIQPQQQLQR